MRKAYSIIMLLFVFGVVELAGTQMAEAQYCGGGRSYNQGRGHAPPRGRSRSRRGYRHRIHGYAGGQVMAMPILFQGVEGIGALGPGGGGGLFGGVRLGPMVALEVNWTMTVHDESYSEGPYTLVTEIGAIHVQTVTADFKLHIPSRGPIEPYFQIGGGYAMMGFMEYEYPSAFFATGPTFEIGGGLDFWLSPFVSVGGHLLYRGMYFSAAAHGINTSNGLVVADSNFLNALSLDINATLHF